MVFVNVYREEEVCNSYKTEAVTDNLQAIMLWRINVLLAIKSILPMEC